MPVRAPRTPRPAPAPTLAAVVAEPASAPTPTELPPAPETAPPEPDAPTAPQPAGYKGLKVWQRALDLAVAVHALPRPEHDQDPLGADLRRLATQVPAFVAAGNSLFQRAEYVQYLSAAHGALARLETLLLVAERLGQLEPRLSAPLLGQASQVGYLLRALIRALQPPAADGPGAAARPSPRRPAPVAAATADG